MHTICDAHCHLQDPRLLPEVDQVLAAARGMGVQRFACCGAEEDDWAMVSAIAQAHCDVTPSFGLHPWHIAQRSPQWIERLGRLLQMNPRAGIGEIGLDHVLESRDDADQLDVFTTQLRLAQELRRPVSIHCRRAWGALREGLESVGPLPAGFVVHSFSGSVESLDWIIAMGGYASFSGSVTRRHNRRARQAACAVPADRLLIETDSPDITPFAPRPDDPGALEPVTDGPNEPRFLTHVLREVAAARKTSEESLAALTTANFGRLFKRRPETCGDQGQV